MDRTFLFLGGLRDEFEPIRSQILNGDEIPGIEEVYAHVESEEQRRQVMHLTTGSVPSAFVRRASGTGQRPARRCTHCNKLGHSADFCWDLHPEKRLVRGRPPSGRRNPSLSDSGQGTPSSGVKTTKLSPDQLKELQAYIGRLSTTPEESSTVSNEKDSQMEAMVRDENEMVSQMEGVTADAQDHLFGQVYVRKEKATVEDVVEDDRTNPNPAISLDDPSPSNEDLPIALRKGTRSCTSHPIQKFVSYAKLSLDYKCFITSLSQVVIPRSVDDAKNDPKWLHAMTEEMGALAKNKTWEVVDIPKGTHLVGSKWVYNVKYKPDGTVDRYKARFVAKGFRPQLQS
ncbi:Uncharacterized protein EJ110_NYTH56868 [Nymphaea thermarum]|nr:Uncharacterized protein EJ110_NYTH56868 [Nymphaea thermarum]